MNPIFSVIGHELTSLKGLRSEFYEVLPPDMDGLDFSSQERVFLGLESDLINTDKPLSSIGLIRSSILIALGK
jgi:hypothetical protein